MNLQKLRHYALYVFIFLCPIIYNTTPLMDLREFQERSFQLLTMCLFALFVGNFWIGAFIILNVSLLLFNDWTIGLPQVLNVFLGSVLFMISYAYFKRNKFEPYSKVLLWLGVLNIAWMIFQVSGIDPLYIAQSASSVPQLQMTFRDPVGLLGIKMANGIFLAILLPIIASINLWLLIPMAIPLFFTRASVVMLAIFVSMSFYFYHLTADRVTLLSNKGLVSWL